MIKHAPMENRDYLPVRGSDAYVELLRRIRNGSIKPGQKLVDVTLAGELQVSRMPVREALLRLTHEGYLVGTSRGFMLPELSERDVADIFEVRKLLEPRAAAAAAQAIDELGLAALEAAYRDAGRAAAARDVLGFVDATTRFRHIWLRAVPNSRLTNTIARFAEHAQTVRTANLFDLETHDIVMGLLDQLMAGFRNRDALAVFDCSARFIDRAQDRYNDIWHRSAMAHQAS